MTKHISFLTAIGFNVLYVLCLLNSTLGNRGYANWVPGWMPDEWIMMCFVLPAIGFASSVISFYLWYKESKKELSQFGDLTFGLGLLVILTGIVALGFTILIWTPRIKDLFN